MIDLTPGVFMAERRSSTLINKIDVLRDAFRRVKSRHTFEIDAMVVLPDLFHLLMTLPPTTPTSRCASEKHMGSGLLLSYFSKIL